MYNYNHDRNWPSVSTCHRYLIRGVAFSSHTSRQWAILVLVSDGLGLYGGLLASKAHNLLLSPPTHARRTANQCGGLISRYFLRGHRVPCNGVTVHRYIVTGTVPQTESMGGERGGVGEVWVGRVVRWERSGFGERGGWGEW